MSADVTLVMVLQQLKVQEATPASTTCSPPPPVKRHSRLAPPEKTRRCRGCRQSIAGHHPLYRCIHCRHHLCRSCFHQHSLHSHRHPHSPEGTHLHTFVMRAGPGGVGGWVVPNIGAASIPHHLAQQLQSRELGAGDYDVLMQLDQQRSQPLYTYLTASLPLLSLSTRPISSASPRGEGGRQGCVFCDRGLGTGEGVRVLPCGDVAHSSCLSSAVMYDVDLQCPLCHHHTFPGLHSFHVTRPSQPREVVRTEVTEDVEINTGGEEIRLGLQLGVKGAQLLGGRRPSHSPAEECKEDLTTAESLHPHRPSLHPPVSKRRTLQGRKPGRAPPSASTLPSLPPIHHRSLTGPSFSSSTSQSSSISTPSPPVPHQRRHRAQSASTTALPPLASSTLLALMPQTLTPHPHTASIPGVEKIRGRGRLHRGLAVMKDRERGGEDHRMQVGCLDEVLALCSPLADRPTSRVD